VPRIILIQIGDVWILMFARRDAWSVMGTGHRSSRAFSRITHHVFSYADIAKR